MVFNFFNTKIKKKKQMLDIICGGHCCHKFDRPIGEGNWGIWFLGSGCHVGAGKKKHYIMF